MKKGCAQYATPYLSTSSPDKKLSRSLYFDFLSMAKKSRPRLAGTQAPVRWRISHLKAKLAKSSV
jgi:hypothetical protein